MKLTAHDFELILSPEHGGSVDALNWQGTPLLLATRHPATGPTDRASFPLIPFAGRIANGRFKLGEHTYQLPQNFPPDPNAIHGFGWQTDWQASAPDKNSIILSQSHTNPSWPSPYHAKQIFTLFPDRFEIKLQLTNTGTAIMPAGLGWHPYFASKGAQLTSKVKAIWRPETEIDGVTSPDTRPIPFDESCDLTRLRSPESLRLDHCFSADQAETDIIWPDRNLKLSMTGSDIFSHFVLYTPQGEPYFCAEPISHVPNAVNLPLPPEQTGLYLLPPGETLSGTITLTPARLSENIR